MDCYAKNLSYNDVKDKCNVIDGRLARTNKNVKNMNINLISKVKEIISNIKNKEQKL